MPESRRGFRHWSSNGSRVGGTARVRFESRLRHRHPVTNPLPFISDDREFNPDASDKASAALGKYISEQAATTKSDNSLTVHLAARLSTLTTYHENWLKPSSQIAWHLLALHQVFFEDIALAHPKLCGFAGVAPHNIRVAVNADLARIFSLAEEADISVRKREYFKVSSFQ